MSQPNGGGVQWFCDDINKALALNSEEIKYFFYFSQIIKLKIHQRKCIFFILLKMKRFKKVLGLFQQS